MLELKDATLSVGGKKVLDGLSMMALDGQMTCITGPEGCGKTLLLRVMMGFVPLDKGLVSVDGELVTPQSASAFRRKMAYVPQVEKHPLKTQGQPAQPSYFVPETGDLETVWSGEGLPAWEPRVLELPVVTILEKPIVLADNPPTTMLSQLRTLANEGRTVVVTSREETFINMSDKTITLGENDHILS